MIGNFLTAFQADVGYLIFFQLWSAEHQAAAVSCSFSAAFFLTELSAAGTGTCWSSYKSDALDLSFSCCWLDIQLL
jgi:hypothetical protein